MGRQDKVVFNAVVRRLYTSPSIRVLVPISAIAEMPRVAHHALRWVIDDMLGKAGIEPDELVEISIKRLAGKATPQKRRR